MINLDNLTKTEIKRRIIEDQDFRKEVTSNNLHWFFHVYFPHYILAPTGDFQKELYGDLEDFLNKFIEILAFRGSAKSTLSILALPISAIVTGKAKFPLLVSDTHPQIKQHIANIKIELEDNKALIRDWGPFVGREEWTSTDIVLPQYGAKISARSTGQKARGIRHKQYRPDLLVADDVENLESVRTKEQRDKVYRWLMGEVLPALSTDGRVILIGNLLHSDSLMMRVKKEIEDGHRDGIVKMYPFFQDKENTIPYWKEKFDTPQKIEAEKRKYGGESGRTWQREFLLKIVAEEGQEIKEDWLKYYDKVPSAEIIDQGTGIDLAISKKETADYTAMVSAKLVEEDGAPKIYIMPHPINERLSQHETVETAGVVSKGLGNGTSTELWVEEVAYQKSAIEAMERAGLPATGKKVSTDKRARLRVSAVYVQNGTVLFPKKGCEDLIIQLLGFGIEAHDDLCDAFNIVVQELMDRYSTQPDLTFI